MYVNILQDIPYDIRLNWDATMTFVTLAGSHEQVKRAVHSMTECPTRSSDDNLSK